MKPLLITVILVSIVSPAGASCLAPYWQQIPLSDRQPISLATADFNGDGKTDIAGMTASSVFVMLNDGTGKFAAAADVYSGTLSGSLIAGDFNGDGHGDLAFAIAGSLVVLPGKGDGTFGTPVVSAISISPRMLAVARFGSDTSVDLVGFDTNAAKLTIFRNNGSGAFTEWQSVPIRAHATAMAAADLDADGKTDVVIAYNDVSTFDVFYAGSDGKLAPAVTIAGVTAATGLRAADIDGDGKPELAFATLHGYMGIIRNPGGRSFGDPLSYSVSSYPLVSLTATDLTGDGRPDLLAIDSCGVVTFNGLPDGTLGVDWYSPLTDCSYYLSSATAATGDFDGDGRTDVVAMLTGLLQPPYLYEFRNLCGEGQLTATTESPTISIGQTETILATVQTPIPLDGWLNFTGTVSLLEGQQVIASAQVSKGPGQAVFPLNALAPGDHTFTVEYTGDPQYNALQSAPLTVHVVAATTTTTLTAFPQFGAYGVDPQLTAVVTSSTGDTPTGPVRFTVDGNLLYVTANAPIAKTTPYKASTVGTHAFVAQFVGDATHPPSRATLTYVVPRETPLIEAPTTFATAGSAGQSFNVVLHTSGNGDSPKGTVTLRNGGTILGTQPTDLNNQFSLPALDAGRDAFRVSYSGDTNYAPVDTIVPFIVFAPSPLTIDARGTPAGVVVTWNGGNSRIDRKKASESWGTAGMCCGSPPWLDTGLQPGVVYLYRSEGSAFSDVDVAMLVPFTDDPMLPEKGVTSTHVAEVVRAANVLRAAAGLSAFTLPPVTPGPMRRRVVGAGSGVPGSDVLLLRNAINEARQTLGAYPYPFTVPVTPSAQINASQLQELREAIR